MFIVYDENMNLKPFPKGVRPLDIFISSIQRDRATNRIEGMHGVIDRGFTHDTRSIEVSLMLDAHDTRDYRLLRDEVFSFFNGHDYLYVSERYERGKRYKVTVVSSFIPERLTQRVAEARFNLELVDLPFAESIGTTQDIQRDGVSANSDLWGYGMGLTADDNSLKYTHEAKQGETFLIYNAGDVRVHPFAQDLRIDISNIYNSSRFFELNNLTNGSTFRITEHVSDADKVVIDGANIQINNLEALRRTNRKYIQLDPGWNVFSVDGANSADIKFDFKFYYL